MQKLIMVCWGKRSFFFFPSYSQSQSLPWVSGSTTLLRLSCYLSRRSSQNKKIFQFEVGHFPLMRAGEMEGGWGVGCGRSLVHTAVVKHMCHIQRGVWNQLQKHKRRRKVYFHNGEIKRCGEWEWVGEVSLKSSQKSKVALKLSINKKPSNNRFQIWVDQTDKASLQGKYSLIETSLSF